MIIFLYGPDTYRSQQKLKEIIEHYQKIHQSGLNLKFLDFEKDSFEDFKNSFRSFSMLEEKKLIVLKNSFSNLQIEKEFLEILKNLSNSKDIFLFYEEEIDEKRALFSSLKKLGKWQNFKLLKGDSLANWVKKEFQKYSVKIDESALNLLLDYVGNNLWQMANEIKKLVNYKSKADIKRGDVEILVKPKIETDIFKTIDAIAQKNKKKALSLVKKHLEKGDSPSYILAMINFQFRNLLMVKDLIERRKTLGPILREIKLHPFVVKKSYSLARKFKFEELKKIYQNIFDADLNIKTGKLEPQAALEMLISEI